MSIPAASPPVSSPSALARAAGAPSARGQLAILIASQALLYISSVTLIAVNGLAGALLAADARWATLPVSTYILGSALTTLPASLAMGRWGRRNGLMFGAAMGAVGAAMAAGAVLAGSFALLCAGTFVVGIYNAFAQYLRFAAADVADAYEPALKERAISWVLAAGIAGGVVGPELAKLTQGLLPAAFAASYAVLIIVALIAVAAVSRLKLPAPSSTSGGPARSLGEIFAQPTLIIAILVGAISYGAMNLLMTATPLAMKICGFGFADSTNVIKWHVVAMFAPGFVTGYVVRRLGIPAVMIIGCLAMFAMIAVAHDGISYLHFWSALVLLGVGWNFMFTAATTLLTRTYNPAEKAKVQGINDLIVFVTMISSSAASGALLSADGWHDLNLYAVPAVAVAFIAALLLMRTKTTPESASTPAPARR